MTAGPGNKTRPRNHAPEITEDFIGAQKKESQPALLLMQLVNSGLYLEYILCSGAVPASRLIISFFRTCAGGRLRRPSISCIRRVSIYQAQGSRNGTSSASPPADQWPRTCGGPGDTAPRE